MDGVGGKRELKSGGHSLINPSVTLNIPRTFNTDGDLNAKLQTKGSFSNYYFIFTVKQ